MLGDRAGVGVGGSAVFKKNINPAPLSSRLDEKWGDYLDQSLLCPPGELL